MKRSWSGESNGKRCGVNGCRGVDIFLERQGKHGILEAGQMGWAQHERLVFSSSLSFGGVHSGGRFSANGTRVGSGFATTGSLSAIFDFLSVLTPLVLPGILGLTNVMCVV